MRDIIDIKNEFINIYNTYIKREGAKELLDYLIKSDFFTAPASTQFHSNFEGGLADHSINVYRRFLSAIKSEYGENYNERISDESIATIDESGIVTGVSAGTVTLTATDTITGIGASCKLKITSNVLQ